MSRLAIYTGICGCALFVLAPMAHAQDAILNQLFGTGVHAYFAGDYEQALQDLTMVIEDGSTDPRVFYFRGLVARRLGMNEAAEEDFARGAELEAKATDRFYPVSRSLERVQGYDRLALEKHRASARVAAYRAQQAREKARYEQFQRAEQEVLRAPRRAAPLPDAVDAKPAAKAPAPAVKEADPFAEPDDAADDDPFGAPAEEADDAADDDPFGAPEADEADDDPFGAPADEDEAMDEAPADAAEDADDPFGAGDDSTEDADAGDPFTDDESEPAGDDEAMEEDPFG